MCLIPYKRIKGGGGGGGFPHILADTPVVLLGPKQAVEEQDGGRPVRVVPDRLGRLVKVVFQGHCCYRGTAVGVVMLKVGYEGPYATRAQSSQDGPCAESKHHSPFKGLFTLSSLFYLMNEQVSGQ